MEERNLKLVADNNPRKSHLLLLLVALVVIIGLGIYFLLTDFSIQKVEIKGNDTYTNTEILDAVKNDWDMENGNICIFTGSNMAGKSTTLKAIASAVWLAHAGFPVPASSMVCPVFDGIFTSINLPDSLRDGRSHFYAEVLRVKEVLQQINEGNHCFVLFDSLI